MGRKRTPPNPTSQAWHDKLARLVEKKRKGLSDEQVAIAAGMTPSHFSQVMGGKVKDPRLSTLRAILDAIGATLADFDRA